MYIFKAPPFGGRNTFRGRPAILPSDEEASRFATLQHGDIDYVEAYATEPAGTEVWIRYRIHYGFLGGDKGRARWQCLARVIASQEILPGTTDSYPKCRTTFQLIGSPEKSNR